MTLRNIILGRTQFEGRSMNKTELVVQLLKIAIAIAFAAYFLWWSSVVLQKLPFAAIDHPTYRLSLPLKTLPES